MKITKRLVLLFLTAPLFLTGCGEDGGFSIAKNDENPQQESTMGDDLKGDVKNDNSTSGASGSKNDEQQEPNTEVETVPTGTGTQVETPTIDLGNQITTFAFTFVKSDEENYANVSFEEDPFDAKYGFSYYTVNDERLEKSEYRYKEIIDGVETYRIYFGSNESGTYVLKFFDSTGKQYGRANVSVKFKSNITNTPYVSVAFNLVRVRFVALTFSVQNVFKKIGNFFSNLFSTDRISL